jgi:RNA polymerase subunit RPABC4/transcription elongation factor Spt4
MENRCVVCGAVIPEGRQICPICEKGEATWKNGKLQKTGASRE